MLVFVCVCALLIVLCVGFVFDCFRLVCSFVWVFAIACV